MCFFQTQDAKSRRQKSAANYAYSTKRRYEGSFIDRQQKMSLTWGQKVKTMEYLDTSDTQTVSVCEVFRYLSN